MSNHDIGQGARVENLVITTIFSEGAAQPRLLKDQFGKLDRVDFGKPMNPTTHQITGPIAMKATARFTARGVNQNFSFGFKQVATIRGHSAFFAGLKSFDGSMIEGTTSLNRVMFLDVTGDLDLSAHIISLSAPFYMPNVDVKPNVESTIEMADHPGGSFPLIRRNALTDRQNFLVGAGVSTEFVTFLVVERPDGVHVPLTGFSWNQNYHTNITWNGSTPTPKGPHTRVGLDQMLDKPPNDEVRKIMSDPLLRVDSSIIKLMNDAMVSANREFNKPRSPSEKPPASVDVQGYAIKQFTNYDVEVAREMGLSTFNNDFG